MTESKQHLDGSENKWKHLIGPALVKQEAAAAAAALMATATPAALLLPVKTTYVPYMAAPLTLFQRVNGNGSSGSNSNNSSTEDMQIQQLIADKCGVDLFYAYPGALAPKPIPVPSTSCSIPIDFTSTFTENNIVMDYMYDFPSHPPPPYSQIYTTSVDASVPSTSITTPTAFTSTSTTCSCDFHKLDDCSRPHRSCRCNITATSSSVVHSTSPSFCPACGGLRQRTPLKRRSSCLPSFPRDNDVVLFPSGVPDDPVSYCHISIRRNQQTRRRRPRVHKVVTIELPRNCCVVPENGSLDWAIIATPVEESKDQKPHQPKAHEFSRASDSSPLERRDSDECELSCCDAAEKVRVMQENFDQLLQRIQRIHAQNQRGLQAQVQATQVLSTPSVHTSPPPPRQWCSSGPLNVPQGSAKFTVLCYNILSDKYATPSQYSYCPAWALEWEYRKKAIVEDIKQMNADIITLQEVETIEFNNYFVPALLSKGYKGTFSAKSRARSMSEYEKQHVDGCAIFWKHEKFELAHERSIEFTQIAIDKAEGSQNMLNRVMTRDNIALVAVLSVREKAVENSSSAGSHAVVGEPIVICNVHIHWDPEFCDVKLVQAMMLVQELRKILEETGQSWPPEGTSVDRPSGASIEPLTVPDVPFLICGDLNSLPQSGVYEFITNGRIADQHADFKSFRDNDTTILEGLSTIDPIARDPLLDGPETVADAQKPVRQYYAHDLEVDSAYTPDIMPFTNYTFDFKGMIDYVFASRRSLARLGVLGPIETAWFSENKIPGCPHPTIPSDHLPLMVQYALLPRAYRGQTLSVFGGASQQQQQHQMGYGHQGSSGPEYGVGLPPPPHPSFPPPVSAAPGYKGPPGPPVSQQQQQQPQRFYPNYGNQGFHSGSGGHS